MFNLKSKITQKLLGYYFINPKAEHYINELARMLKLDVANLDKKLKELEKEGLFISEMQGNLRYFFLNKKYPLLGEIKKMYALNYGLEKKLAKTLKNLKGLQAAYIFGSYAKSNMNVESDVDVLLIGSHASLDAKRQIEKFEDEIKREINVIDMTEKEFLKRKKTKDEFIANIFQNKIIKII